MALANKISGKLEVTGDIGERLDKQLEAARADANKCAGAAYWLAHAADKSIPSIHAAIDRDFEDGKIKLSDLESDLQLSSLIKLYVSKASESIKNLSIKKKHDEVGSHGRAQGLEEALKLVQKHHNAASVRAQQLIAAARELQAEAAKEPVATAEEPKAPRLPGQHPGPSKASARRREAQVEQIKKKAPAKKRTRRKKKEE